MRQAQDIHANNIRLLPDQLRYKSCTLSIYNCNCLPVADQFVNTGVQLDDCPLERSVIWRKDSYGLAAVGKGVYKPRSIQKPA